MNEIQTSHWKSTVDTPNLTCNGECYCQGIGTSETILLPFLIGIICSASLAGNVRILFTKIKYAKDYPEKSGIVILRAFSRDHAVGLHLKCHEFEASSLKSPCNALE